MSWNFLFAASRSEAPTLSGWFLSASFLYADRISASVAVLGRESTAYGSMVVLGSSGAGGLADGIAAVPMYL